MNNKDALIQELAPLIRSYYDNRGQKLEETCHKVIDACEKYNTPNTKYSIIWHVSQPNHTTESIQIAPIFWLRDGAEKPDDDFVITYIKYCGFCHKHTHVGTNFREFLEDKPIECYIEEKGQRFLVIWQYK